MSHINNKNKLQELCHILGIPQPTYRTTEFPPFRSQVYVGEIQFPASKPIIKKKTSRTRGCRKCTGRVGKTTTHTTTTTTITTTTTTTVTNTISTTMFMPKWKSSKTNQRNLHGISP